MTQGSMPADDGVSPDGLATSLLPSPYQANEWHGFWNALMGSAQPNVWIIPGIGGNLAVTQRGAGANMSVDVAAGEALVNGERFKSDAVENLAIAAAHATLPRLDRIVLRYRYTASTGPQDVRLAVVQGVAADPPALPALTQSASVYEVDIAHVWVGPAVGSIVNAEIHDQRVFAPNLFAVPYLTQENLIHNSEFMAFSRLCSLAPTDAGAPDGWDTVGTVTTWASATKPSQMSRGRAVQMTVGGASAGMEQKFRCKGSTPYVFRTLINVTAGDVGIFKVTDNGGTPATVTRNIRRTGSFIEETIYYTTPADATEITVQCLANANTDIVQFGQVLADEGYNPGPFRQVHEEIIFEHRVLDPDYYVDTFVANNLTTINLSSDYEALILPGTRAVYIGIVGSSTDAAGAVGVSIRIVKPGDGPVAYLYLDVSGGINTFQYKTTGWSPVLSHTAAFAIGVNNGSGTLTLTVEILGISI